MLNHILEYLLVFVLVFVFSFNFCIVSIVSYGKYGENKRKIVRASNSKFKKSDLAKI